MRCRNPIYSSRSAEIMLLGITKKQKIGRYRAICAGISARIIWEWNT